MGRQQTLTFDPWACVFAAREPGPGGVGVSAVGQLRRRGGWEARRRGGAVAVAVAVAVAAARLRD